MQEGNGIFYCQRDGSKILLTKPFLKRPEHPDAAGAGIGAEAAGNALVVIRDVLIGHAIIAGRNLLTADSSSGADGFA